MVLVEVSVVEQRYQAVLAVQAGSSVVDVAARFAVSRQSVHNWLAAYRDGGLAGLETRSRRPDSSPWQAEVAVRSRWAGCAGGHPVGEGGCRGRRCTGSWSDTG